MIKQLRDLLEPSARRHYDTTLALFACAALFQGIAFVLLVPVLRALFAPDANIWVPVGWLALATVAFASTTWVAARQSQRIAIELASELQRELGDVIARLPLGTVDLALTGRLARLTSSGIMNIAQVPAHLFRLILNAVVTPATVLIGLVLIDWRIALAVLICAPLLGLTYKATTGVVARRTARDTAAIAASSSRIVEFARVQPALRAFGGPERTACAVHDALVEQHAARRKMLISGSIGMSTFAVAVQAVVTLLMVIALWLAADGAFDAPAMVAAMVLGVRFAEPLIMIADLGSSLRVSHATLAEVNELLSLPELSEPAEPAPIPTPVDVELRGVRFGYTPQTMVLDDVSFKVAPGTTTAIVGPSGSGKTTLTKLIARFHDVDGGAVLLGGVDVRELGTAHTMSLISPVFQDVFLFSGTLLDNIRMGRPGATEAQVLAAGEAAAVDEIAARLAGGWQAQVGEGGSMLSGGERQRVSIARAILKDAPILLLDEATSALDAANELAITQGLDRLEGRTRIVVAHRLSTIAGADQIVVLRADGRVAQTGTHEQLLAADGPYRTFWRTRTRAQGWVLAGAES